VLAVFVDVSILNVDGNLFDAALYAAVAALASSKMPKYEVKKDKVKDTGKMVALPMKMIPVSTTFAVIDDTIIADPTRGDFDDLYAVWHYADLPVRHLLSGRNDAALVAAAVDFFAGYPFYRHRPGNFSQRGRLGGIGAQWADIAGRWGRHEWAGLSPFSKEVRLE